MVLVLAATSRFWTEIKCEAAALLEDVVESWGWGSHRVEGAPIRAGVWCEETGVRNTEVGGAGVREWVSYWVAVMGVKEKAEPPRCEWCLLLHESPQERCLAPNPVKQ